MLRKMVCAGFVVAVTVGITSAEEIRAIITKVEDGKVTYRKLLGKFEKGQKPEMSEPMTLPTSADVKVVSAKFNKDTKKIEAGEALAGGLKNEALTNVGDKKGVFSMLITDAGNKHITEIRVFQGFGKKKKGAE